MPTYRFDTITPAVSPEAFVHPTAVLIGDVIIEAGCYVGPNASLRGDFGRITLLRGSNVQDNCVMHSFPGQDSIVEEDGHIGHGAILHGCRIKRGALVGMNAVIMDGATIGELAFVAAMSFVPANFCVPPRTLALGTPAKILRELSEKEIEWKANGTRQYQDLALRCLHSMVECEPTTEIPSRLQPLSPSGESHTHRPKHVS